MAMVLNLLKGHGPELVEGLQKYNIEPKELAQIATELGLSLEEMALALEGFADELERASDKAGEELKLTDGGLLEDIKGTVHEANKEACLLKNKLSLKLDFSFNYF